MTDAGKGVIDLDLDDSKVKRKLRGLDKGFSSAGNGAGTRFGSGFLSSVGSSLAGVGRLVATAGAAAAAGLGAIGVAAGGYGLKIAAENETAAVSFELLLGSAEKSGAFLKDLQAFAAKTPFEFPELRDAASRLLAVGTEASRVIPIMETLGDATAAMGTGSEGINRAVTALTQMEQKGKVTGEEMLQLTEAGIPAWDALAAVMGVSVVEAQEKVSKGTVSATELFQALEQKAGPALQRVTGLMDVQAQTLQGLLSTLKDTVSQNLGLQLAPLAEAIKGLLPDITELAGTLATVFGAVGSKLAGPLVGSLSAIGNAIAPIALLLGDAFVTIFANLASGITALAPGLTTFVAAFAQLGDVVGPVVRILGILLGEALTSLAPVLSALVDAVEPLVPILGEALLGSLKALRPIFPVFADAIKELSPLISDLATAIGDELVDVFKELVPVMIANAPTFIDLAEAMLELLVAVLPIIGPISKLVVLINKFQMLPILIIAKAMSALAFAIGAITRFDYAAAWGKVTAAVAAFARTVGTVIPKVVAFFQTLPGKIISAVGTLATVLIPKGLELIGGFLTGMVKKIPYLIGFMLALPIVLQKALVGLATVLIPKALSFLGGFLTGLVRKLPELIGFMVTLPGKLLAKLADVGSKLIPKGVEFIGGLLVGMIRKIPDVISWFQGLPGRFVSALGAVGSRFIGIGRSIVEGIWQGIQGAGGWLLGKIKGFVGGVVDGFMGAILGHSPSKLFEQTVGRSIGEGVGVGIEKHVPKSFPIPSVIGADALAAQLGSIQPVGLSASAGPRVNIENVNNYDRVDSDRFFFDVGFKLAAA